MFLNFFTLIVTILLPMALHAKGRSVSIEWEEKLNAKNYELEFVDVTDSKNPQTRIFKTKQPEWTGDLSPGIYRMRIRSIDKRSVAGEWSPPEEFVVSLETPKLKKANDIFAEETETEKITLEWSKVPYATEYQIIVKDKTERILHDIKTDELDIELPLSVAQGYIIELKATSSERKVESEASDVTTINLIGPTIGTPKFEIPETEFVRELQWSQPDYSKSYSVVITRFDTDKNEWVTVSKVDEHTHGKYNFPLEWPGGRYKAYVTAKAPLRKNSKTTALRFKVIGGNRSPAAEEIATVRRSIDRTEGYFAIASYLITQINYQGSNQDFGGAEAKVSALGGTGRLGLGYLSSKESWGYLGIMDYSGFIIGNKNHTFASMELNSVYRKSYLDKGELRQHIGLFYKEIPELIGTGFGTYIGTEKISTAGPHYGLEYWHALSPKLGFQINFHTYLNLLKIKTPNGNPIKNDMSYQIGILGSYRLKKNMTGLAGYALRRDSASYKSGNGDVNQASVLGNYLNFFLEWSL